MKNIMLLTICGILLLQTGCNNSKPGNFEPKNMVFIPAGILNREINGRSSVFKIDSFYISNEITNKEYRTFYDKLKNSPDDTVSFDDVKIFNEFQYHPSNNSSSRFQLTNSQIVAKLINEKAWQTIPDKPNYFRDPKYDDYPAIGITFIGAVYYCIWLNNWALENKSVHNKKRIPDYSLPADFEWQYMRSFKELPGNKIADNELHPVTTGDKNSIGILNLKGNVSEWVINSIDQPDQFKNYVYGGSWRTGNSDTLQLKIDKFNPSDNIGFRIACRN